MSAEIIGYTASGFYILSLFPEIYSIVKEKKCNLSYYFIFFQIVTTILFIAYDILIDTIPLLISDVVLLVELLFIICFKINYQTKNKKQNHIIGISIV